MLIGWWKRSCGRIRATKAITRLGDLTHRIAETAGRQRAFSGLRRWVAGVLVALAAITAVVSPAAAENRSLKIRFVHTGESAEVVFKRDGRYDRDGLNQLNRLLRDFRRNEPTKMDPRLFDLVWAIYRQTGSRDYINVLSGYRSPATNAWLRRTRGGQAEKSQHILGKAMDFYIPGVSLKRLREIAMKQQGGGVGYYPRSGAPFVHVDVARVRAWPRMTRQELVRLFPDGKTLHLPADGKPLPGYEAAMAAYQSRQKTGDLAMVSSGSGKKAGGILASMFSDDTEGEDGVGDVAPKKVASKPAEQKSSGGNNSVRDVILAALPTREKAPTRAAPRPDADVGGGIQDVVGAPPAAAAPAAAQLDDVPVPTRRPAYTPAQDSGETVELASLGAEDVPLPTRRPGAQAADALAISETQDPAAMVSGAKGGRIAASDATRVASLASLPQPQPEAHTTEKASRPSIVDAAPAPKPAVRPVAKKDVEIALNAPKPEIVPNTRKARTFATQAIEKPTAVYMTGFSSDIKAVDINRFTGKAVEFQTIAKFQKAN